MSMVRCREAPGAREQDVVVERPVAGLEDVEPLLAEGHEGAEQREHGQHRGIFLRISRRFKT